MDKIEKLVVAANTDPSKLAGAITPQLKDFDEVVIECVGSNSLGVAIKACIISRSHLARNDFDLQMTPCFIEIKNKRKEEVKKDEEVKDFINGYRLSIVKVKIE